MSQRSICCEFTGNSEHGGLHVLPARPGQYFCEVTHSAGSPMGFCAAGGFGLETFCLECNRSRECHQSTSYRFWRHCSEISLRINLRLQVFAPTSVSWKWHIFSSIHLVFVTFGWQSMPRPLTQWLARQEQAQQRAAHAARFQQRRNKWAAQHRLGLMRIQMVVGQNRFGSILG